jgi:cation-transporting ATPase E
MPQGLSEAEARARRAAGQGSAVAFAPTRTYRQILKDDAFNPINVTSFVIGAAFLLMIPVLDAFLTVGVVMLNVVVAVIREGHAKRKLERIELLTQPKAAVIRDVRERPIGLGEIVVGDVLIIQPDDQREQR